MLTFDVFNINPLFFPSHTSVVHDYFNLIHAVAWGENGSL